MNKLQKELEEKCQKRTAEQQPEVVSNRTASDEPGT